MKDFVTDHLAEHLGKPCPICGDTMTSTHDNFIPTWSDEYDNIVCWWCSTHVGSRS